MNVFLIAAPVGIALNYALNTSETAVFLVSFVAIIPIASLLTFATEEIEHQVGPIVGGLLNATFGNAVELIIAVAALLKGEVEVAKTSMIGSVLSNLLPVLGCCFFFGGLRHEEQTFSPLLTQTANSFLVLALAPVTMPTALTLVVHDRVLFSHRKAIEDYNQAWSVPAAPTGESAAADQGAEEQSTGDAAAADSGAEERPTRIEEPQLLLSVAIMLLIVATVVIAFCAEFLVGSIDGLVAATPLSKNFVGLILLHIVGNAAEHAAAVKVAMGDDMDLAISIAIGSSIQVALLLLPLVALIG
ncbi:sodium/calcium transporter [Cordyceps javanica]|uniref:Sodium/calcium transporter n=1 Tax=Cordyceps javanica TaxID=43265 RepID=A0A545UKW3_9HYPO|nr:sodium/calcium transporter [Cordyceps javanica]TQW01528.1 sodium/calcium transporter [Cordyceps javanica]